MWHCKLEFPDDYPKNPPDVTLMSDMPLHPNVFGRKLCLDMLEPRQKNKTEGWTSAYSVMSIVIQLQSFLFVHQEKTVKALKEED